MAHQKASHSPVNESESKHVPNTYVQSKARVFFVRHGKSVEDSGEMDSIPQSNGACLDYRGIRQMKAAGIYLKIAGITSKDSSIMYGNDTVRVTESVQIITEQVVSEKSFRKKITPKLRTTKKGLQGVKRIKENTSVFTDTTVLMEQIRRWVNIHIKGNNIGVILVGHKSNKSGSEQAADNINDAIDISFDIENGDIIERDIDADTGKYVNPKKHPETLFLNRNNYREILKSLENITKLKDNILKFKANSEGGEKYPIWELQNDVNEYFITNKALYIQYISSGSQYLKLFCLANLIIQEEYTVIENYYLTSECENISEKEKRLLLQNTKNEKIMNIFRKLFVCRSELWLEDDYFIVKEYFSLDEYAHLKKNREIYQKAQEIESRSLDIDIKTHNPGAIIEQKTIVKRDKEEIDIDLDTIIQSIDSYILLGMVGSGKSLWTTSLVKKIIIEYPEKQIIFFEGGDWSKQEVRDIESALLEKIRNRHNTILVIDAFDEMGSDTDNKKKISEILKKIKQENKDLKIIITGRPSEFNAENNEGFETLGLLFNRDDFIELKGGEYKHQIQDLIKSSPLNNATIDNPLFVFFICELANNYDRYKNIGILSLEEILKKNQDSYLIKIGLYENILKLIIAKYKGIEPDAKNIEGYDLFYQDIFSQLSILALGISYGKNYIEIAKEQKWTQSIQSRFFNDVSILFKKNEKNDYRFAHLSFQEYFVYKYREDCYKDESIGEDKWLQKIEEANDVGVRELLICTGLMNLTLLKQDILKLLEQGSKISINVIFNIIIKIIKHTVKKDIESLMSSSKQGDFFKMTESVMKLREVNDLDFSAILEKIIDLDEFKESSELVGFFLLLLTIGKYEKSYIFLEKIMNLKLFKSDVRLISLTCFAIRTIKPYESYFFLKEISKLDTFRTNIVTIFSLLTAVDIFNTKDAHNLLEEVVDLETFKESSELIFCFLHGIINSKDTEGHSLLEKIVDLEAFKGNPEVITTFCLAIGKIEDLEAYNLLEKVVDLEAFKGNPEAIYEFCWAIGRIKHSKGYNLLEKVVDLEAFKGNPEAIYEFCWAIAQSGKAETGIHLLEKAEIIVGTTLSKITYEIACAYSLYNVREKSLQYLDLDLSYQLTQSIDKLKERLIHITQDPDWNNMRDSLEFQSIIQKYEKIY